MNVLIFFDTRHGQTGSIANRLVESLTEHGVNAKAVDMRSADASEVNLDDAMAIVVGASVYFNRHSRLARKFVRRHIDALNSRPSFFFSTSMSAHGKTQEDRNQTAQYEGSFLKKTGWSPRLSRSFAGGLAFTKYWWLPRIVMRSIAARKGLPTDTSKDYEFTDWDQVNEFAQAIERSLGTPRVPVTPR